MIQQSVRENIFINLVNEHLSTQLLSIRHVYNFGECIKHQVDKIKQIEKVNRLIKLFKKYTQRDKKLFAKLTYTQSLVKCSFLFFSFLSWISLTCHRLWYISKYFQVLYHDESCLYHSNTSFQRLKFKNKRLKCYIFLRLIVWWIESNIYKFSDSL